ncbi:hypothetical protein, partial [Nocardioides sp.]|uniref:hypothetical protein n=1 Tax=Nocardioides sp. TaxID=35761 RepID=UPI002ED8FA94
MRPVILGTLAALAASLLTPAAHAQSPDHPSASVSSPSASPSTARMVPGLKVRRLVTGLDHPWDVRPIGEGRLIFTQRDRATVSIWTGGHTRRVRGFPSSSVWVSG